MNSFFNVSPAIDGIGLDGVVSVVVELFVGSVAVDSSS
jgi:hypothetical protein